MLSIYKYKKIRANSTSIIDSTSSISKGMASKNLKVGLDFTPDRKHSKQPFFLESGQIVIEVNRPSRIPVKNDFKGSSKLIFESYKSDRLNDFESFLGEGSKKNYSYEKI